MKIRSVLLVLLFFVVVGAPGEALTADGVVDALKSTGLSGGLVVHLGCGGGRHERSHS